MKKIYKILIFAALIIFVVTTVSIKVFGKDDLKKNLVLYYKFDVSKEDTVIDSSGNKNDGTLEGTAKIDTIGRVNGGLTLDGNGSVRMPDKILNGLNEVTICAWVEFNASSGSDWQRVYDFGSDSNNNLFLSKNRTNNFNCNKNVEGISGGKLLSDDTWHFITTVITKDTMIYYENGVEIGKKEQLKNKLNGLKDSVENYIGKSKYDGDPNLTGFVDEFRIYSKALTPKQINDLMYYKISDEDIVTMDGEKIGINDGEEISSDLILSTKLSSKTKVKWTSSNKSIISEDGKVTLPSGKDDTKVTLSAKIQTGKAVMEKKFEVYVVPKGATNYNVQINTNTPKFDISPTLYGLFFEDINHSADGGLYSQLIQNNSFEYEDKLQSWELKKDSAGEGKVEVMSESPLNENNADYARLEVLKASQGVGIINSGYKGISVKKGAKYDFSIWERNSVDKEVNLFVQIENSQGKAISDIKSIPVIGNKWSYYESELTVKETDDDARLYVYIKENTTIDMDMISLFPQDTWKGEKHGLRKDLVQMLYDMKPKFLRFPGGCIVQGKEKEDMYEWKDTIGKIEERKVNKNFWGYYQSYGLGFYEYFKLCEDIGAEPLPVINVGMSWQSGGEDAVSDYMAEPGEELNKYIQDALDLIEYANGDATTTWGKKRAESGHPAPFNLKYLEIGNEQWGDVYFTRFQEFEKAIKQKYPSIQLVVNSGTAASGNIFDAAWNWTKSNNFTGIVDEHYYMPTDWFLNNANRYDSYDRNGAKVFVGEYAAQDENKKSTLETAIAEAAYMTGLEKNSDIVKMASYAPLFAKENDSQWTPDMIWFNGSKVYGTPDYYVQKIFSENTGNKLLETSIKARNDKTQGMYIVSSMDEATGEVIIKAVNSSKWAQKISFDLGLQNENKLSGLEIKLTNKDSKAENSSANPNNVVPISKKIEELKSKFEYNFDGQSVTIIRLKIK
ncbi:carbohydrate binding domain-containing protein [Clostridium sp. 19966]|uniref:alpha-L-arabinofuranosidase C-terminal domain-containing protein n=1 Tax=Clostridium sp. 19966 TaxID=2768166 RepID=UPI0028DF2EC1|nr:alpha-L-arabinofuranosidase C-terminal domain-containing protein [Clostridium sp. 19966]MDT8719144.1 carbohydrate binding domain-containing protein [Clostridium sp. 19966]